MTASKFYISLIASVLIGFVIYFIARSPYVCGSSASETKLVTDAASLTGAIEYYKQRNGSYPKSLNELLGNYFQSIPLDPWGNAYGYISNDSEAIVFTYGKSGSRKRIFHIQREKI